MPPNMVPTPAGGGALHASYHMLGMRGFATRVGNVEADDCRYRTEQTCNITQGRQRPQSAADPVTCRIYWILYIISERCNVYWLAAHKMSQSATHSQTTTSPYFSPISTPFSMHVCQIQQVQHAQSGARCDSTTPNPLRASDEDHELAASAPH